MKKQQLIWVVALVIVVVVLILAFTQRSMTDEEVVREAVLGSGSATCTFVDPDTKDEFDIMFKDGKTRMNIPFGDDDFFLIAGDENVYVWWSSTGNEGFFFPVVDSSKMEAFQFDNREVLFEEVKDKVTNCSAETISNELFEAPSEISFYSEEEFNLRQSGLRMEDFEIEDLDFEVMEGSEIE